MEIIYRGYSIRKKAPKEWAVTFAANSLKDARQIINWMIYQGCLKGEHK